MTASSIFPGINFAHNTTLKVWVLAPYVHSTDENIDYYYDFSQSIEEYTRVFTTLQLHWQWQPVTMLDYVAIINQIANEQLYSNTIPLVLNLCDGDEVNGTPGISIVKLLEEKGLIYTGADEFFYNITTSKVPMKKAFDVAAVPNACWTTIHRPNQISAAALFSLIGSPVIIKPAVSGGSMGVGVQNVIDNPDTYQHLIEKLFSGYRGWNLTADGLIAEKFISGPEFTVFICGSYQFAEDATIFTPVERVFHHSLPDKEKFLSFDRLWEIYEDETAMPNDDNFYEYRPASKELIAPLQKLSWDAFCATRGQGYTRVDIRMDQQSGQLYVLEVNAQCGISEDENFTSIGAILKFDGVPFSEAVRLILKDALQRASAKNQPLFNSNNNARA